MRDNLGFGVMLGLGVFMCYILSATMTLGIFSNGSSLSIGIIWILQGAILLGSIAIPIVLYKKGLRKAMKAYLFTVLTPVICVLLLFGSCLLMIRGL